MTSRKSVLFGWSYSLTTEPTFAGLRTFFGRGKRTTAKSAEVAKDTGLDQQGNVPLPPSYLYPVLTLAVL